ncbi:hypothetical protein C8Q78DRAFT_1036827 [Trametes maxima]|nr:hypothetical protein C8Q78DRAFT_1036827 [Trametes maxima]
MLGRIWSGAASSGISDAQVLEHQLRRTVAAPTSPSHRCRHSSLRVTQQRAPQATSTSSSSPSKSEQRPSNSEIDGHTEKTQLISSSGGGPPTDQTAPPKSLIAGHASTHQSPRKVFRRDIDTCVQVDHDQSRIGTNISHAISRQNMVPAQTVKPEPAQPLGQPSKPPWSDDHISSKCTKRKREKAEVEEGLNPSPGKRSRRMASPNKSRVKRPRPEDTPCGPPLKRQRKVLKPRLWSSSRVTLGMHISERKRRPTKGWKLLSDEDPAPSAKPSEHAIPLRRCSNANTSGPSHNDYSSTFAPYPREASTGQNHLRQAYRVTARPPLLRVFLW